MNSCGAYNLVVPKMVVMEEDPAFAMIKTHLTVIMQIRLSYACLAVLIIVCHLYNMKIIRHVIMLFAFT